MRPITRFIQVETCECILVNNFLSSSDGEALHITQQAIVKLGNQEADLSVKEVDEIISSICEVASRFNKITQERLPEQIRSETLQIIQS